jgi:hypothetical protein
MGSLMVAGAGLFIVDTIICIQLVAAPTNQADSGTVVVFATLYAAWNVASLGQMVFADNVSGHGPMKLMEV